MTPDSAKPGSSPSGDEAGLTFQSYCPGRVNLRTNHTARQVRQDAAMDETDLRWLRRCVELAGEAGEAGDFPFGSVLVDGTGRLRAEDRNREVSLSDPTRHPEFELARWAATNLTAAERRDATVYTSGEHCPMCAAAHAWVGLGRIVYAMSSAQLTTLRTDLSPVRPLPIHDIAPYVTVEGPAPGDLVDQVAALHRHTGNPT
jgi:tRNA(Arg) A34 adenosine deaminase TadA